MSTTKRFSPSWDPETTVVIKIAEKPAPEARTEALIKTGEFVYPAPTTFHKQVLSTLDTSQKYSFFGEHGAIMGERRGNKIVAYALSGGYFSASNVFTTLQLFNVLRGPVTQFPSGLSQLANLVVAMRRIGNFLKRGERAKSLEEHRSFLNEKVTGGKPCVVLKNATFSWVSDIKTSTVGDEESEKLGISAKSEGADSQSTGVELKEVNGVTENISNSFSLSAADLEIMPGELVMVVGLVSTFQT